MKKNLILTVIFCIIIFIAGCAGTDSTPGIPDNIDNANRKMFYPVTGMWESLNGPPGGYFKSLVQNPTNPEELYALSQIGLFKTINGGDSWELIDALEGIHINDIAPYKHKLYLGGSNVIEYSEEHGVIPIHKGGNYDT